MSEDIEKRWKLAKDIVSAIVREQPELEHFTDQRSIELVHLPKLERLYKTVYYPAYRDAPSPEDFRRELLEDFDKWDEEIKAAYQAYKEATTAPGRPISLSPNTEDKENAPRRRYLYALFTNTLKTRFLQLSFPIMLEAEAAQLIQEAEDKAARMFREWKNQARYILAEADPEILTEKRRAAIEAHQKSFTLILHTEATTRLTLLFRVKRVLKDIKAGRDSLPATHYTNRLAHRMANARIIEHLTQLIEGQEVRKAEPLPKPTKQKAGSLTTWERCMYYRYLYEAGAPTPFDNDRKKQEAYNELAERHGGSAAHWKNTWLETEPSNRKYESKRRQTGLKKVLKLLEEYPDAYRLCEMELRNAGIL